MKKVTEYQIVITLLLCLVGLVLANYWIESYLLFASLSVILISVIIYLFSQNFYDTAPSPSVLIDETTSSKAHSELVEMQEKLQKLSKEDQERRWQAKGRTEIGDLLRQAQRAGSDVSDLCDIFLKKLISYLNANQGCVFLINEEKPEAPFIELISTYAYNKKKHLQKKLNIREGLLGQCILEKASIYLEEIPDNYIYITSGLGEALPKSLLIVPIKTSEKVLGALEIASFRTFTPNELLLADVLAERLAGTIATIQSNLQTKKLLDASNRINRKLIQKEEQMRINAEELSHTKEELSKKLLELEQETNLSSYILEAINKTNAAVEFDFNGKILAVNDMYLRVMGYKKEELIGENETMLLTADELDSQRYQLLWDSLRNGSYITGEYKRISKTGREVWLNGTYNPIFDVDGKPSKVIQFAQFTTEEKEKDLDYASKINALNQSLPVLELDLKGNIKTANPLVANKTGYKRSQLINKPLQSFLHTKSTFVYEWLQIQEGESKLMNIVFVAQDEKPIFFFANFSPIKNLAGKIHKVQVILIDLTAQKAMEIELLNKQDKMQEMLNELENTQIELQNRERELERLLAQERAKNVILSTQDVKEEMFFAQKLEQILDFLNKENTQDLNLLVQQSTIPVVAINKKGNILLSNSAIQDLLRYSSDEANRLTIHQLLNGEQENQPILEKVLKGDVVKKSIILKDKTGNYIPSRLISMPTFSENADMLVFLMQF
jgi:PAS domain S-box-containing protein